MRTLKKHRFLDAQAVQDNILNKNQQKSIIGGYLYVCCYWAELVECGLCGSDDIKDCNDWGPTKYPPEWWGPFIRCE